MFEEAEMTPGLFHRVMNHTLLVGTLRLKTYKTRSQREVKTDIW